MDWDYTLPRDEHADYVWGGQWLSSKEIDDAVQKSPFRINECTEDAFQKYHRTWSNTSEELENVKPFKKHRASVYGLEIEDAFEDYIKQNTHFCIRKAGKYDDHRHRTDYFLGIKNLEIPIDVKALKSVRRNTHQNKYFWIELHRNGWLFGPDSRSSLLAIECFPMSFKSEKGAMDEVARASANVDASADAGANAGANADAKAVSESFSERSLPKFVLVDKIALKEYCKERFKLALSLPPVMNAPQAFLRAYRRKKELYEWTGFVEFQDLLEHCALCRI